MDTINQFCTVRFDELRIKHPKAFEDFSKRFTAYVTLPAGSQMAAVWAELERQGFEGPDSVKNRRKSFLLDSTKRKDLSHDVIKVVACKPANEFEININETFRAHANRHHGKHATFDIWDTNSRDSKRPKRMIKSDCGFGMSFQRRPRMPDDNRLHQLPGSLGSFELFNVEAYSDRLPANIRNGGGVFLPMWQREALWINFETGGSTVAAKYAVRVFVGKINAVSGLHMDKGPARAGDDTNQDYVVIPGQRWLDGICVAPGIVRQFVAMPLGSGYTVEGQKTSEEKYGGLQIEVIPQYQNSLRVWVAGGDVSFASSHISEMKTPSGAGLSVGKIVKSYPADKSERTPCTIDDMAEKTGGAIYTVHYRGVIYPVAAMPASPRASMPASSSYSYPRISSPLGTLFDADPWSTEDSGTIDPKLSKSNKNDEEAEVDGAIADLKAMGLAAGGKLVQDIYKDNYPSNDWNHAAARIINVHILDPASCEKVTHIVALPPPKDAKSYASNGGKFFVVKEQVDNRVEGGDFKGVKSVSQMDEHIGVKEDEFDPTKPSMCAKCKTRLTDCIVRPCNHQFCNVCIKTLKNTKFIKALKGTRRKCPTCRLPFLHVAGFSAPMNLPGEEPMRMKVPVNVLEINDGRVRFKGNQTTRI